MADVPTSYFGTEAYARFKQMQADIFKVEAKARALGFEEVRLALYRSRIALGQAEEGYRREYAGVTEAKRQEGEK
jgi:hypothetical protein